MAYMHMAVFVAQATHCQPCFKVHIMAATNPLGGHGGKRDNSGRKKKYVGFSSSQRGWNSQNKRIYLTIKIFDAWKEAKIDAGKRLKLMLDIADIVTANLLPICCR